MGIAKRKGEEGMLCFDSASTEYKSPFGAVCAGERVRLRAFVPRRYGGVYVRPAFFSEDLKEVDYGPDMVFSYREEDCDLYEGEYTPRAVGLYFYGFAIWQHRQDPPLILCRGGRALACPEEPQLWQLTVYRDKPQTPSPLLGGVMYQIFPDRFYFSGKPKEGVPSDRILREDKQGTPYYLPNEQGVVENRDYFQGDFAGIMEKLPYIRDLGVNCIYLNPIFEAHSNHRYNTADYHKTDPLLGTEEEFAALCRQAGKYGIKVILDGVFSHTGSDSIYFNREGRYGEHTGAYRSQESPYYPWFKFTQYPDKYASWWGIDTLPEVKEENPDYLSFITGDERGKGGVLEYWMKRGAYGYRLDVADELPDVFLDRVHQAVKSCRADSIVIGEVWEDASNKISYGKRRRYLLGGQLDSVMNYPFKNAVIDFVRKGDGDLFFRRILTILENYPPHTVHLLMNSLSTHDTERALTLLAAPDSRTLPREEQAEYRLSPQQYRQGVSLLKIAITLQFFLPGIPCIYYGDEIGMYGYRDPFARKYFDWDHIDGDLLAFVKTLGQLRRSLPMLAQGNFVPYYADEKALVFLREEAGEKLVVGVNLDTQERWIDARSNLDAMKLYFGMISTDCICLPAQGIFLGSYPAHPVWKTPQTHPAPPPSHPRSLSRGEESHRQEGDRV